MESSTVQPVLLEYKPKESLTFTCQGRVQRVAFKDLLHIRKNGDFTLLYTCQGEFRSCQSLQQLLRELPVNDFFRVHRSHIVALLYIRRIAAGRLMIGDEWIPFTPYYKAHLLRSLQDQLDRALDFFILPTFQPGNHEH